MSRPRPPRLLEALAALAVADAPHRDATLGDLAEEYGHRVAAGGRLAGRIWYLRQALSLAAHAPGREGTGERVPAGSGERLAHDVRAALKGMARRPGFTAAVTGVLGVALAATVAAFSVTAGTLDAARWWQREDRTVLIWPDHLFSMGQLATIRDEGRAFEAVGAFVRHPVVVAGEGTSETATAVTLSPEVFGALRARPRVGRGLVAEDAEAGGEPVVVLGHALWTRAFGADPGVVGRLVEVGGLSRRVVGVMPRGAGHPGPGTELWLPLAMDTGDPDFWPRQDLTAVGLLAQGITPLEARDDVRRVMGALARRYAFFFRPDFGADATVEPSVRRSWGVVATPLLLLLAGAGVLLLVAAIDVGGLVLARALERGREMRVRAAVGATRRQVAQQIVVEAGLRALLAGGLGWGAGAPLARSVAALFPHGATVAAASPGAPAVLAFVGGVTALAWLLMAAVPSAHVLLRGRSPRPEAAGRVGAAGGLVVAQAALATVLLVTAALLVRTVAALGAVPLGFDPADVVAADVAPRTSSFGGGTLADLQDRLGEALAAAPGVAAVGWISAVPLLDPVVPSPVNLEDAPTEVATAPTAARLVADVGALDVLGIDVVRGRGFTTGDRRGSRPVALVNEAMARAMWPGRDPVGRGIAIDPHDFTRWVTVVGVVEDARWRDLTFPVPPAYVLPRDQAGAVGLTLVARAPGGPAAVGASLRATLAALAPDVPAGEVRDLPGVVADAQGAARVLVALLGILAVLATALGAVGLYGALAAWVARRRGEIGTRLALGASPGALSWRVVRSGLALTAVGLVLGSAGGVAAGRGVRSLLYGVSPLDPVAFLAPAVLLLAAALVAAAVPALRAAAVSPQEALRGG